MKATIRFTSTLLTFSAFVLLQSCSSDAISVSVQQKKEIVTKNKQQEPPLIVRQFGGCKAHQ